MMSLRDKDIAYATKQEDEDSNKVTTVVPSSSRQWSGFKNPRIVRVSRTFGGKDRHSKVCTVKGLRDRRIRLSVPTAIQLYDLQDRLGLNQPSKVIDWLLDTTKQDIDKLPPLPIIPGIFNTFQGYGAPMTSSSNSTSFFDANLLPLSRREDINVNTSLRTDVDNEDAHSIVAKLKFWESMRSKQGEIDSTSSCSSQVYAQNLFPIARGNTNSSTSSVLPPNPSLLLSNDHMFNNYYHWEPSSNLSLAQLGTLGSLASQNDNSNPNSLMPSSLSLASGSRLFMSPSMATTPVYPTHTSLMNNSNRHEVENELRQFNHFDNSSGLGLGPFPFTMIRDHDQSHNMHQNDENHREKGED